MAHWDRNSARGPDGVLDGRQRPRNRCVTALRETALRETALREKVAEDVGCVVAS